jgi:hypothetical protein
VRWMRLAVLKRKNAADNLLLQGEAHKLPKSTRALDMVLQRSILLLSIRAWQKPKCLSENSGVFVYYMSVDQSEDSVLQELRGMAQHQSVTCRSPLSIVLNSLKCVGNASEWLSPGSLSRRRKFRKIFCWQDFIGLDLPLF